jgi:hypothetical protein
VDALLDEGQPSLAFFAAWAMKGRHGPEAERVVKRTMEVTDRLPVRALRQQQRTDIMGVLNGRLADKLKERVMEPKRSTEPRWVREMREEMYGATAAAAVAKDSLHLVDLALVEQRSVREPAMNDELHQAGREAEVFVLDDPLERAARPHAGRRPADGQGDPRPHRREVALTFRAQDPVGILRAAIRQQGRDSYVLA